MSDNAKLEVKKARLKLYLAAEKAILSGQSYEIEGLKLTRANLKDVQTMIAQLEGAVEKLSNKGHERARLKFVVPRDNF
jgi:hypothetical protein